MKGFSAIIIEVNEREWLLKYMEIEIQERQMTKRVQVKNNRISININSKILTFIIINFLFSRKLNTIQNINCFYNAINQSIHILFWG